LIQQAKQHNNGTDKAGNIYEAQERCPNALNPLLPKNYKLLEKI